MKKLYLLIAISLGLITSCGDLPTDFTAPNWDADFSIPITEKEYKLGEIIKTNKNLMLDSIGAGNYLYKVQSDNYVQNFQIDEYLKDQLNGNYTGFEFFVATGDTSASVDLSGGVSIDSAFASRGTVELKVDNKSKGEIDFSIELPAFKSLSGVTAKVSGKVAANSNNIFSIDIANHSYTSKQQASSRQLFIKLSCKGQFTGEKVNTEINIKNTAFTYINGRFASKAINPISKAVALPLTEDVLNFRDKFTLSEAVLNLKANYVSPIPNLKAFDVLLKDVRIVGKRKSGGTFNLKTNTGSESFGDFAILNGNYSKRFDKQNSNISEFLSFLPDSIVLNAGIIVNQTGGQGAASVRDTVKVTVDFNTQTFVTLDKFESQDTLKVEFDDDIRKEILKGKFARVIYDITNELPIDASATMTFLDKNSVPLFSINNIPQFKGGRFNSETNIAPNIEKGLKIELSEDNIKLLAKSYNAILKVIASTTQATNSNIKTYIGPNMKLKVKTYGEIRYNVNPN